MRLIHGTTTTDTQLIVTILLNHFIQCHCIFDVVLLDETSMNIVTCDHDSSTMQRADFFFFFAKIIAS